MSRYVPRLISDQLLRMSDRPVLVLEGARGVGKTSMVVTELQRRHGYSYASLDDPATLKDVAVDLGAWLRTLRLPAIIDEAQMVPDLPLELKRYVDTLGPGGHFVITGSASISRTGLGGSDPLVRRASQLTMHPLTRFELNNQEGSLVDMLFDSTPLLTEVEQVSDTKFVERLRLGGFPQHALWPVPRTSLRANIAADTTRSLSGGIQPRMDFNEAKARAVLDALLREPGGIFGASALGSHLDTDRRTVERYVDIFGQLFLVHWLPNLAARPTRQDFTRAKMHPGDTAFAVDALERAGVALPSNRVAFGKLLESYVVGQLRAHSQWGSFGVTMGYWRRTSGTPLEVDLVMVDWSERTVAVEVKAATSVSISDFKAIKALESTRGLHRGFVFYRGSELRQFGPNLWALPMSVVEDPTAFAPTERKVGPGEPVNSLMMPASYASGLPTGEAARLFLSYLHADDQRENGRIVQFVRDLGEMYSHLYGSDLQLFVDRDGIPWGEQWESWLRAETGAATFLLAAVTPNYLRSEQCRKELLSFSALATSNKQPAQLILPLLWVNVEGTDVVADEDPVLSRIRASQMVDVTNIWQLPSNSVEYSALVRQVAARLRQTIETRARTETTIGGAGSSGGVKEGTESEDSAGFDLTELVEQIEQVQAEFETAGQDFGEAIDGVMEVLNAMPSPNFSSPQVVQAAMIRLAKSAEPARLQLAEATKGLTRSWQSIESLISNIVAMPAIGGLRGEYLEVIRQSCEAIDIGLEVPGLEQFEESLSMMSALSRHLRPLARTLTSANQLSRSIKVAAGVWVQQLAEAGP